MDKQHTHIAVLLDKIAKQSSPPQGLMDRLQACLKKEVQDAPPSLDADRPQSLSLEEARERMFGHHTDVKAAGLEEDE